MNYYERILKFWEIFHSFYLLEQIGFSPGWEFYGPPWRLLADELIKTSGLEFDYRHVECFADNIVSRISESECEPTRKEIDEFIKELKIKFQEITDERIRKSKGGGDER